MSMDQLVFTPREPEAMAVTLARMEGKLDSVKETVSGHAAEIVQHREQITRLQAVTQKIESEMKSAEASRISTATALREANEARAAAAKATVDSTAQKWTPLTRLYVFIGTVGGIVAIIYYLAQLRH